MLRTIARLLIMGLSLFFFGCELPSDGDEGNSSCQEDDSAQKAVVPENLAEMQFFPSNLDLTDFEDAALEDIIFEQSDCAKYAEINTDDCSVRCINIHDRACSIVEQLDGSELAVLTAKRFEVDQNVVVSLEGQRPLIVLSTEEMIIDGTMIGLDKIYPERGLLGGFSSPASSMPEKGRGFGGGGEGGKTNGAGGGAYCGAGGDGGADSESNYTKGEGGAPYGNSELVPLQGGSGGGKGDHQSGGAGGGGLQLVSAISIDIGPNGGVHMPGNGGSANSGNGGGSGGAILIEAPVVTLIGAVTANGGGGGAGNLHDDGAPGSFDDIPAMGGRDAEIADGGDGSAALVVDGFHAEDYTKSWSAGGGGGGAGWIRFNTSDGTVNNSGIVSPSIDSPCASVGTLD